MSLQEPALNILGRIKMALPFATGRVLAGALLVFVALSTPTVLAPETERQTEAARSDDDDGCLACHGDAGRLIGMVLPAAPLAGDGCASAPSRPEFIGYFVNRDFPDSLHGRLGCTGCHGGDATAKTREAAHQGMIDANAGCADCHGEITDRYATSLHNTLNGMAHALNLRSTRTHVEGLRPVWQADCATCHASCSDCHITLPAAVGGGLIKGHEVLRRAPMELSCALCHGSRAGGEFLGQFEGLKPDIHFEKGMHCMDCHKNDLHGDGRIYETRWQVRGRAQCTDCHATLPDGAAAAHNMAHADVACQVCHSQPYQNCFGCHSAEEDGVYFRRADSKQMLLRIGRNTAKDYPYGFVTLRHNPVARDSFDHFGAGLLPDFDDYPTWKTAAPHNIRRVTSQNQSCNNCHDNETIFLGKDDLAPKDSAANHDMVRPAR